MVKTYSNGVIVTVQAFYLPETSNPMEFFFNYCYKISIKNSFLDNIQLLRRWWIVFDSMAKMKEIEGTGVVGKQPLIRSGEVFQYTSGVELRSEFGYMHGEYEFINARTQEEFFVKVPRFDLMANVKTN